MGDLLFQRICRVTLIPVPTKTRTSKVIDNVSAQLGFKVTDTADAIVIENLRVQFKIKKDLAKTPNPGTITITNLAPATRGLLTDKGVRVILDAGYPGTISTIYSGDATHIDHVRDGADWTTKIECGDGTRAMKFARVNVSFGDNTPVVKVAKWAAGKLGIDIGNLEQQFADVQLVYANGYSAHGSAADEMNSLMKAAGKEWSIQDGRLQVLAPGASNGDQALDLTPESGLIGSPAHGTPADIGGPPVLKAKSLLAPTCKPGSLINIHSANVSGTFRIVTVEHDGDTASGPWYTDLEVTAA